MPITKARASACLGLTALLISACQEPAQSPPSHSEPLLEDGSGGSMLEPVDLVYICGNKFLATNSTPNPIQLEYRVAGTQESGTLILDQGVSEDPGYSETELETAERGVVELYRGDERIARRRNGGLPCGRPSLTASVAAAAGDEATTGMWSAPFRWPVIAVHLSLLSNGKVLSWGEVGDPWVWTPSTDTFKEVPVLPMKTELFCTGHTFLPDGRLMVTGGHFSDDHGLPDVNTFRPGDLTWISVPKMSRGRWYPTATPLGNGQVLALAGRDITGTVVTTPEVWTGSGWRRLTGANRTLPYYPRTFAAPNGRVFYAGERQATAYLSTSGTGSWKSVGNRLYGTRDYGAAVMYEPGKVIYIGGGRTTNTAEIIDLNWAAPAWQWTGSMAFARRHLNATLLPDGTVLVTGGTAGTTHTDESTAVFAAELWNPATGLWTTLASGSVIRGYHSTAVLLRDGRVLVTGSGDSYHATDQLSAELFSPPYLFKGLRPTIVRAPGTMLYGQTYFVETAEAASISQVTLVRLGSTTHAFNMNQRFNRLAFSKTTGGLNVTAPAGGNLAPPGHYLLFILNEEGVPSTAKTVRLK